MTKRVKQHQLEDLSRAKYSLVIPINWVFRDKYKDYGIDAEIEIFDDKDKATGLVYWVQLKATESKVEATAKKVDLSIESIKYYKKLDIPVLIARYSKNHDCFYFKWAHEIDLYYAKENAKTFRVKFSEEDKWSEKSPEEVKSYLEKIKIIKEGKFQLPIPLCINVKDNVVNEIPRAVLISSLRMSFCKFPDFVVLKSTPKDSLVLITIAGDALVTSLSSIVECTFHGIEKNKQDNFGESIVVISLLGFAITLSQIGQFETMARILFDKKVKKEFFQNKKILYRLLPLVLQTSYFDEALDAVIDSISGEDDNMLEVITNSALLFKANPDDEKKIYKIEAFLNRCLEKYLEKNEKNQIGICYYNLGNHYRSRRLNKKAIHHYLQARKYEEKYLNQPYYYQELASVLFGYGKYFYSALMYEKALREGAPESIKPLYADALMFSGDYQSALDVFSDYLSSGEVEHSEWHLKKIFLEELIDELSIKKQTRQKKEALNLIDITKSDDKNFEKLLETAIIKDSLCGPAWFNLGVVQHKKGKLEEATFSFTACGLLQTGNIAAWLNAASCCLSQKNTITFLPLIIEAGHFFNGDQFLSELYTAFSEKTDPVILDKLSNAIEKILPAKHANERPAIRLLGEDGIFRNILEEKPNNANSADAKSSAAD